MFDRYARPATAVAGSLLTVILAFGSIQPGSAANGPSTPASATPAAEDAVTQVEIAAGFPGTVIATARDGQAPVVTVSGVADLAEETPIVADDRFRSYSLTKTLMAVVVLQMVEEAAFTLDDTVTDLLTDPTALAIPNADRITVRQLLQHTSGIYDYIADDSPFFDDAFFGPTADWSRVWTPQELLGYAAADQHAPHFEPGMGTQYSNTDYILLGLIVEKASGHPLADAFETRLFAPLGMVNTVFTPEIPNGGATVRGYQEIDGENVDVSETNISWAWAAGGAVSTVNDVLTFAQALFTGELLEPASYAAMTDFGPDGTQEGMGLFTGPTPVGDVVINDGNSAGFTAYLVRVPAESLTLVLLTNTGTPRRDPQEVVIAAIQRALEQ